MREILFRGKRQDNGEWIEGLLMAFSPRTAVAQIGTFTEFAHYVRCDRSLGVDPSTVGQYTGLKDNNGQKIFEGDVVDILTENDEIGVVAYEDGGFLVNADGFCVDFHFNINGRDLEVIGNIHDNPELLEGGTP